MTDNQTADNQRESKYLESGKQTAQRKLLKDAIDVLRENREALSHLPELLEQLIDMPEATASAEKTANAVDESSDKEHKLILAQREKEELDIKIKFLLDDNDLKDKRIKALEKTVKDKTGEIMAVKRSQSEKMDRDERVSSLQKQLQRIEEEKAEKDKRILLLEKEAAEREKGLLGNSETLKRRNDDLLRDVADKEEKLKVQEEKNDELILDISAKDEEIKMLKEQVERFDGLQAKWNDALSNKDREMERIKTRLASLSEKRVKQDQTKVEDTLSLNRQSKVEEDFANFIDEGRMDALDKILEFYNSKDEIDVHIYYPRLACLIFEAAYERMKEAKDATFEFYREIVIGMVNATPKMSNLFTVNKKKGISEYQVNCRVTLLRQEAQYPTDVLDALMINLKETGHTFVTEWFHDDVLNIIWKKWEIWLNQETLCKVVRNRSLLLDPAIDLYIKQCMRLTWRMVTQIPAMELEYKSSYLKQNIHKKLGYHSNPCMRSREKGSCGQVMGEEIACYLWPGLVDGGGRLIRAGEVLCKMTDTD